jgi:hypothetical protein
VKATFYNAFDYVQYVDGKLRLEDVRKAEVEAMVDTGAAFPAPVIKRPRGTTPIIGVVALEQMGFRVDPTTGKLVKGLPLML